MPNPGCKALLFFGKRTRCVRFPKNSRALYEPIDFRLVKRESCRAILGRIALMDQALMGDRKILMGHLDGFWIGQSLVAIATNGF
jgi:hypothetical protein